MPLTGPFLLTNLLLDDLNKAAENGDARVVVVTSALHDARCCKRTRSKTLALNVSRKTVYILCPFRSVHSYTGLHFSSLRRNSALILNSDKCEFWKCRKKCCLVIFKQFLPRCMECSRGIAMRKRSVCPSVKRVYCDKTEERSVQIFISYERSFSLVFWKEEWLVRGDPFYLKCWVNWPPLERNRRFWTNNSLVCRLKLYTRQVCKTKRLHSRSEVQ